MGNMFRQGLKIIRQNLRAYLLLNLFFYGLMALSILYVSSHPEVGRDWHLSMKKMVEEGALAPFYKIYYVQRNIPLAFIATFLVNLILGSVVYLSLPSFVIPFSGIALLMYRFVAWGLTFGPVGISHLVPFGTVLLEGQGYIIAALAIYLHSSRYVRWRHYGFASADAAFRTGFSLTVNLYSIIGSVLLVAALFESAVGISTHKQLFPPTGKSHSFYLNGDTLVDFSGSKVFFNPRNSTVEDAREAGALLEEIDYFRMVDTTSARIDRSGSRLNIEVWLPSSGWRNAEIKYRFARVCKEMNGSFANRRTQITAVSVDSAGNVSKRVFQ